MQKDYNLIRGQSKSWTLKFRENGSAVDITGYKIFLTIKSKIDMTDANAEVAKDITNVTPATGDVPIELTSTDTANLAGKYYYDIKVITADTLPKSITPIIGTMQFQKNVTIRET
jgi:predicted transport protein